MACQWRGGKGVLDYKSDKRDARASAGALDRTLITIHDYLDEFNRQQLEHIAAKAQDRFADNPERRDQFITEQSEKGCPFTVNMVLHSMGNYLFKQVMQSGAYASRGQLIFDNVIMAAADTNNLGHAEWVDRINVRKRVYITVNEDDSALRASRIKAGEEQLARLDHFPYNLYSKQAVYVNFTDAAWVRDSHAYFEGQPLRNKTVKRFFNEAFNGQRAETALKYNDATRMYLA